MVYDILADWFAGRPLDWSAGTRSPGANAKAIRRQGAQGWPT
jgi:hypothetical protein